MTISEPTPSHMTQLRQLWKTAFGDGDDFLDMFYTTAYAPHRCRCMLDGSHVAAVLYWFDCACESRKLAYIYAVATDPNYRNQGLCRKLMTDTHVHLKENGYAGALLLPQDPGLRQMYGKMGYTPATCIREFECAAAGEPAVLTELTPAEYAALRKPMLPPGSVIQEEENLSYLAGYCKFYQSSDFLAVVFQDADQAICYEFLGNVTNVPAFLQALGAKNGTIRTSGTGKDFAMYTSFDSNCLKPAYFAFAFD